MSDRASVLPALGVVAAVGVACAVFRVFGLEFLIGLGVGPGQADLAEGLFKLAVWVLPAMLVARAAAGSWPLALGRLGLSRAVVSGVLLGVLATLPMLLAMVEGVRQALASFLSFTGRLPEFDPHRLAGTALLGPFAEEILFRGLLVGHLITVARWRPASAIVASTLAFTLAHVGDDLSLPLLASIAVGGLVFGWLFVRWQSIWPAVSLHVMINFFWDVSPTTIGVWHAVALLLAVGLTIVASSRRRSHWISTVGFTPARDAGPEGA